jgi:AcrR family transcriptional regulator
MPKQSKGMATKQWILDEVSRLYNDEGLKLTLDQLARKLGLTKGRITNHFPKKEYLLLAIFQDFDHKANLIYQQYQNDEALLEFSGVLAYYSEIMDLQYRYRAAVAYLAVQPIGDPELQQHLAEQSRQNKAYLKERIAYQVRSGSIQEELLEPKTFEVFCFQLYNLFTSWVVSLQLYYKEQGYEQMKPIFLQGIMNCFVPYLTEKGKAELQEAFRQLLGEQPG